MHEIVQCRHPKYSGNNEDGIFKELDKVIGCQLHLQISEDTDTAFIAQIEAILDDIEIPKSLAEIDVPMSCVDRIAEKAFLDSAASTNPRKANLNEMRQLIETAIIKARH